MAVGLSSPSLGCIRHLDASPAKQETREQNMVDIIRKADLNERERMEQVSWVRVLTAAVSCIHGSTGSVMYCCDALSCCQHAV